MISTKMEKETVVALNERRHPDEKIEYKYKNLRKESKKAKQRIPKLLEFAYQFIFLLP